MKGVICLKHNTHLLCINKKEQLEKEMKTIGADLAGINLMLPKGELLVIKVQQVSQKAAIILKQEMLSKNGEAVLHRDVSMLNKEISDILLIGTIKQFTDVIQKLKLQPFGLKGIANEIIDVINSRDEIHNIRLIDCKGKPLIIGEKTLVMGILNITPDSFSDGGKYTNIDDAVEYALKMVNEGADIIDVGGESTRPGHSSLSDSEELRRILPIIEKLAQEISVPISVDTYKAEVAKQAIKAGAHLINDVWGLKRDRNMAGVAAELEAPVILMHNREIDKYISIMDEIISDLRNSIAIALDSGINRSKIIIDPGIGFAKSYEDNLVVMNRLDEIVALGYPVLLGTSRKSLIGNTLNLNVDERVEGTIATVCYGITKGCKIVRVHDVKQIKRACNMMDKMIYPSSTR